MKNKKTGSLLLVISSEGIPVMVVPATNIQDAHNQARILLRDEKSRAGGSDDGSKWRTRDAISGCAFRRR